MLISSFDALTMLSPKIESFNAFYLSDGGIYHRTKLSLDELSNYAATNYTADFGYNKSLNDKENLGFRFGRHWLPVTKNRANKMLKTYGFEIVEGKGQKRLHLPALAE